MQNHGTTIECSRATRVTDVAIGTDNATVDGCYFVLEALRFCGFFGVEGFEGKFRFAGFASGFVSSALSNFFAGFFFAGFVRIAGFFVALFCSWVGDVPPEGVFFD